MRKYLHKFCYFAVQVPKKGNKTEKMMDWQTFAPRQPRVLRKSPQNSLDFYVFKDAPKTAIDFPSPMLFLVVQQCLFIEYLREYIFWKMDEL